MYFLNLQFKFEFKNVSSLLLYIYIYSNITNINIFLEHFMWDEKFVFLSLCWIG